VELVSPFSLAYAYKRSLGAVLSRFATALRDGRLLGARTASGRVLMPPLEYDPDTGEDIVDLVEVGTSGTIRTWTWVPEPREQHPLQEPFAFALVQLDGADTAMLQAVRADGPEQLQTGARVRVVWSAERAGSIRDFVFEVSEEPAVDAVPYTGDPEPVTRFKAPTRMDYVVRAGGVTADFLKGILNRELIAKRCPSCEKVYVPPRGSCPTCGVPTVEPVKLGQRGTVTTFSVIRFPFEGQMLEPPYACAHVVLDGADVPLLHLIGECDVDNVRMGMRVEAVWSD
jgi:hypothetical protein